MELKIIRNTKRLGQSNRLTQKEIKEIQENSSRLGIDSRMSLTVLHGPKFTKKMVEQDFPEDSSREAIIIRRSVRL